jgi:hypothetical protein
MKSFITANFLNFLRVRNVSDKIVEKMKTHFISSIFFPENLAFYATMWKYFVDNEQATDVHIRGACALCAG